MSDLTNLLLKFLLRSFRVKKGSILSAMETADTDSDGYIDAFEFIQLLKMVKL